MPLTLRKNIENGEIGLWKITEDIDELYSLAKLPISATLTYSKISATHRKKEWLATRVLLNVLVGSPLNIRYHNDGRPYLEESLAYISISHSSGYVAIILHESYFPGIDIELITRKVGKVANRFLSPDELAACNSNQELSNHRMLLHWCAKEAIFKMIPLSEIEFSTDISILIDEFVEKAESFRGTFNSKDGAVPITLYHKVVADVLIVWGWVEKTHINI